jgi:hypothetical protein
LVREASFDGIRMWLAEGRLGGDDHLLDARPAVMEYTK